MEAASERDDRPKEPNMILAADERAPGTNRSSERTMPANGTEPLEVEVPEWEEASPQASQPLLGRAFECELIDELIASAVGGESGCLVVRGEPGIGKSALLDYAAGHASGMRVLTTAGVEAETDLAFAGLYSLVRPILGHLTGLPELQAKALAGALGLAPSSGSERLLVSAAVLGLLAEAADERPILCLVDDAHWLDTPSADALAFAARRLRAERVAMVFAARNGDTRAFESPGLPD